MASIGGSDLRKAVGECLPDTVSIPTPRTPLVPLPDLYRRLNEGATGPLTVVRGPAAAGKTALAAAWLASEPPPGLVVWLSLEEQHDEPVRFWGLVVEALRRHGVNLPVELRCPSEAGSLFLTLLEELSAVLRHHQEPVVLVLDHFDWVTDPRVLRQVGLLLRKAAPALRLVVTTRRPPPGVLGRRRLTVVV
jgi:LuxR family transcriptional regulator, maltose regulon positive regulatory protein